MKLDRNSKKLLNIIIKSKPTIQDKAYDIYEIAPKINISEQEFYELINHLEKEGAIQLSGKSRTMLFLTEQGRHYRQFEWSETKEFIVKSVAVPIGVSIITAVLTTLVMKLL